MRRVDEENKERRQREGLPEQMSKRSFRPIQTEGSEINLG